MNMQNVNSQNNTHRGVTLLVAILVTGLVLAIGTAILNITLKQFILAGVSRDSAVAFYAADAGLECGKYWDRSQNHFVDSAPGDVGCFGDNTVNVSESGGVYTLGNQGEISLDDGALCVRVMVSKITGPDSMTDTRFCPDGFTCTKIESRGYNASCDSYDVNTRTVERALRANYGGCRDLNQNDTCDVEE